jgi:IS6 family transposase
MVGGMVGMDVLQVAGVGASSLKDPNMETRPAIFKWRQTEPVLILCAVCCYLRYSQSLRDVEELLDERGLQANHLKPTNKSWRVDETYVLAQGRWCYLYRAIDSAGATIDFLLSALRDADAASDRFAKVSSRPTSSGLEKRPCRNCGRGARRFTPSKTLDTEKPSQPRP